MKERSTLRSRLLIFRTMASLKTAKKEKQIKVNFNQRLKQHLVEKYGKKNDNSLPNPDWTNKRQI